MGWKSTVYISRAKALELIQKRILTATNDELADAVEGIGYGDNTELDYYGHNFIVQNECEDEERAEYERLKEKFGG